MSKFANRKLATLRKGRAREVLAAGSTPSNGQFRLLKRYGKDRLTAEKLEALKLSHKKYLAQASFGAKRFGDEKGLTLPEAERIVEAYLETL